MTILPIIVQPLNDLTVVPNTIDTRIDLFANFDDPSTSGLIARFDLYNTGLGGGKTEVLLFDQSGVGAPITVENFIGYVERNEYVDSIIHRSVPGFIIQGGGFAIDGIDTATVNGIVETVTVITGPTIQNEFSLDRSNLRGTIAMAKVGGDPDSATSQWFFNLADNSANLDNQNGGFTVFGQVLSEADLAPLDAIAALPRFNATQIFGQSAFGTMPLNIDLTVSNELTSDDQLVRYQDIIVFNRPELTFTILNNSNPTLVNPSIEAGELVLDYGDNQVGTAEITIQATTLLGESTQDTFVITIEDTAAPSIPLDQTFSYLENQTSGFTVGTIVANDNIEVTGFTIVSGNGEGFFAINSDGNLILTDIGAAGITNDFESGSNSFTLEIIATDSANNLSEVTTLTVTVLDVDEVIPVPSLTIAATGTPTEEDPGLSAFTLTLSAPAAEDITVSYTVSGTATPGTDYTALPTAVTIVAGQTSASLDIIAIDDDRAEETETIIVSLTEGTGYTLGATTTATLTIANDDGVPPTVQQITSWNSLFTSPGELVTIPLFYNASTADNTLGGIGLRLHYNSSDLTFQSTTNLFNTNLFGTVTDLADTNNFDGDTTTNRYLQVQYVDVTGNWPNQPLPLKLGDFSFTASNSFENTQLRITALDEALAPGYSLEANPILVGKREWTLDIDGDGRVGALSDGIMVVRHLFGAAFAGETLITGAISPNATRDLTEIQNYLREGVDQQFLDIDGDGRVGALSDGIMVVRHLFGAAFAGETLITGAISPNATRDLAEIQSYLADLT